jgi:hypothetical protein
VYAVNDGVVNVVCWHRAHGRQEGEISREGLVDGSVGKGGQVTMQVGSKLRSGIGTGGGRRGGVLSNKKIAAYACSYYLGLVLSSGCDRPPLNERKRGRHSSTANKASP